MATKPDREPKTGFARYFNSATHYDVILKFGDEEVKGHKIILAASSEFFRKAFEGGFRETASDKIELHDDDPDALKAMLGYCYGVDDYGYYTVEANDLQVSMTPDQLRENLMKALQLYLAAGKYIVPKLQKLAVADFSAFIWDTSTEQAEYVIEFAREVYALTTTQDKSLRKLLVEYIADRIGFIRHMERFDDLLKEVPELAVELVKKLGDVVSASTLTRSGSWGQYSYEGNGGGWGDGDVHAAW